MGRAERAPRPSGRARGERVRAPGRAAAALAALLAVAGCGGGAAELLSTAEFEELQQNRTHARELYERIVRDHPGTPEATTAAERLRALDANP